MKMLSALMFSCMLVPPAIAQKQTFTVSPDASEAKMTLKTNHEIVNGTFHVQSGSIAFDRSTSQLSGMLVVASGSGQTGNSSRDKKMNKDILKVSEYATVSFAPKTYTGTLAPEGDSEIQTTGTLTLLGTLHEITVPIHVHIDSKGVIATTHFVIPYVQWGLKNPSFLIWKADSDVAMDIKLSGFLSQ